MSFKVYIEQLGRTPKTIDRKSKDANFYLEYLSDRGIDIKQSRYDDIMNFIGWMKANQRTVYQINRHLNAISDYYNYLEIENPAYKVRLRGVIYAVPSTQFTSSQLDQIYECYEPNLGSWGYFYYSDKLILSLIIYQGLELNSFYGIRIKDVDLVKGRIFIRAHNRREQRYIPLKAHQVYILHQYLENRAEIIQEWLILRKYLPEAEKQITDVLFSPQCEKYSRMHGQQKHLSKQIKKQVLEKLGLKVKKLTHLRQSRMCIWIEEVGVRKAQYYAGLKSVMSIERYKKKDLKGLKKAVQRWHPR